MRFQLSLRLEEGDGAHGALLKKRSKGNRLDDYLLLTTLTNMNFSRALLEELNVEEEDLHLLVGDNWCLYKFLLICFFVFTSKKKTNKLKF